MNFDLLADQFLADSDWLDSHTAALASGASPYWDCWWEEIGRIAAHTNAAVDAAARSLAAGKPATAPAPEICAFLQLRRWMAVNLLHGLADNGSAAQVIAFPNPVDEMTGPEVLEWLLVDFWNAAGKNLWHSIGYWESALWEASQPEPPSSQPPEGGFAA